MKKLKIIKKKNFNFIKKKNYKSLIFCDLNFKFIKWSFFFHKKIHQNKEILLKNLKFKFLYFKSFFIGSLLTVYYFNFEKIKNFKGKILKIFKNNNNIILLDIYSDIILKISIKNINLLVFIFELNK
jgi:hypothetical protein